MTMLMPCCSLQAALQIMSAPEVELWLCGDLQTMMRGDVMDENISGLMVHGDHNRSRSRAASGGSGDLARPAAQLPPPA